MPFDEWAVWHVKIAFKRGKDAKKKNLNAFRVGGDDADHKMSLLSSLSQLPTRTPNPHPPLCPSLPLMFALSP